ncbi:putative TIM-barrel fold metal-dependent hydrolase [Actinokineospora baliensis]|uniref:amidohydrolase family protein n=1 Tax=Actinokineospora baliensis TaxID=547056 RepID=UPI00195D0F6E|nr:amidohydrolase family protein [Actinokineospora baliensis]MBM7772213.1 putative TIM-barrel fold metal-dependent hydrolase [Actinokineospora baliensis]
MGPGSDAEVAGLVRGLGVPGLVDVHVHFLPERVQRKVWAYFDDAERTYGLAWPIHYRGSEGQRVATLRALGVVGYAPLVYPHKPGMAEWLTEWVLEFAARVPEAVPTATVFPEPSVIGYLETALRAGVRCVKAHVQVGGYDPREPVLDPAWGMLAEAGVPVVVHCGHGPLPGEFTGLPVFEEVLRRHPRLTAVLAHAGMPETARALDLAGRYSRVYLDTTMVGVEFTLRSAPLPPDWTARLADLGDRVVLGTDFPSIPYSYAEQLRAIWDWAQAPGLGEPFLRAVLHDNGARLLALGEHAGGTEPDSGKLT